MILVEGEKYACEQCIRGHRSSTCKHIKRPLVLVRSRGRPLTDSTQRIAIMAEEVQKLENQLIEDKKSNRKVNSNDINIKIDRIESNINTIDRNIFNNNICKNRKIIDSHTGIPNNNSIDIDNKRQDCCSNKKPEINKPSSCCSSSSKIESPSSTPELDCNCCSTNSKGHKTCKNKSKSVFVLKASKRQVYNVEKESLKLLDPIIDIPNNQVGLEIMNKVSKLKKHGVNVCKSRKIKQERLVNDLNNPNIIMNGCTDSNNNVENKKNIINNKGNDNIDLHQQAPLVYQFQLPINDTNYSLNRSAGVNNIGYTNSYPNIADLRLKSENSVEIPQHDSSDIHPILKSNNHGLLYDLYIADSCTVPGSCTCEPDKCACANCSEHNSQHKNSNLTLRQQFDQFPFPITNHQLNNTRQDVTLSQPNPIISYGQVEVQPSVPTFEQNFYKILMQQTNSTDSPSSDLASMTECLCNADECACFNCESHGIVNGVRLSDNVIVANSIGTPNEIQLLASEFPINNTPTPVGILSVEENSNNNFMFSNSVTPKRESPVSCCSSNNKSLNVQINNGSCCNSTEAADVHIKEKIFGKFNPVPNFKRIDSSCCSGKHIQVDQIPNRAIEVNSDNYNSSDNNNINNNVQTLDMNSINVNLNMNDHELLYDLSEFDDCTCPDDSCNCENCFRHGRFGNMCFS